MEDNRIAHIGVKTEGFDKTVVFMMELNKMIWDVMSKNRDFRIVVDYHADANKVQIDFLKCEGEQDETIYKQGSSPVVGTDRTPDPAAAG